MKKKICCTFFYSHNYLKIENYFTFDLVKQKIWSNLQRVIELFTHKIVSEALKNMGLGSGIRDPGSRIQGSKRHQIPDPHPLIPPFRAHFKQQQHERADMISMTKVEKEKSVTKAAKAVEALHRQAVAAFRIIVPNLDHLA
jgi:hypothetical protein